MDDWLLLLVGGVLWLFYRDQLTEAWQQAAPHICCEGCAPTGGLGSDE